METIDSADACRHSVIVTDSNVENDSKKHRRLRHSMPVAPCCLSLVGYQCLLICILAPQRVHFSMCVASSSSSSSAFCALCLLMSCLSLSVYLRLSPARSTHMDIARASIDCLNFESECPNPQPIFETIQHASNA